MMFNFILFSLIYKITLRINGGAIIKIDNISYEIETKNLTWIDLNPMYLEEGNRTLEILANDSADIDVVWLYSVERNETLEDLFASEETPAEVLNYSKINPTLWKVQVNASKPFMLSFAESYDPLWEARVYKDGKKVEVAKSIQLYGVI
ncbi:MAG: hypothetical protein QXG16_04860, partial [Candidatus Anstonellaceae archaeon]